MTSKSSEADVYTAYSFMIDQVVSTLEESVCPQSLTVAAEREEYAYT